jgi:hypothetical protein
MELQDLLIEGIEFLESLPESEEINTKLASWRDHLNQVNATTPPPKCQTGYYWNGLACVKDVG